MTTVPLTKNLTPWRDSTPAWRRYACTYVQFWRWCKNSYRFNSFHRLLISIKAYFRDKNCSCQKSFRIGWPYWANFRHCGECLLWALLNYTYVNTIFHPLLWYRNQGDQRPILTSPLGANFDPRCEVVPQRWILSPGGKILCSPHSSKQYRVFTPGCERRGEHSP
jgi:hypothetical protein